jgi:hypothetical protein
VEALGCSPAREGEHYLDLLPRSAARSELSLGVWRWCGEQGVCRAIGTPILF